ncbi:porin family protein [Chroococcidiopsis sp. CCMEE 29]|uniref:porin family protein n=1 Tax=Chroococcidiopsis sp. CCMEE 29 TaxID=155894 RepID=UPI002021B826|nr:porin family protein [Chroococcidiopsis sp. CCMEE 29]
MKTYLKSIVKLSALSALVIAPVFLLAGAASAQPTGTNASYLGAGLSVGVTEDAKFGGNIQGRLAIPNTPVSARGAILFSDKTSAIMPIVSYDVPITNNANAYLGAGYSFVEARGQSTPLGNKNAVVLTTGVEAELRRNIVLYGDAKVGINAFENNSGSAVSFQAGAGYRFN